MEDIFKPLTDARNSAHLTAAEKAGVLNAIYQKLPAPVTTPSPYPSHRSFALFSRKTISVTLLVLLTGGIGFSAAADNSLPNSALYPIKINITEPVQDLIKITPSSKVEWEIAKTERRFSEAAELARTGELTPQIESDLAEKITEHVQKATATAEESISDVSEKLEFATELKTVVEVEAQKLQTITESIPQAADTTPSTTDSHTTEPATDTPAESVSPLAAIADTAKELVATITEQQETHIDEIAKTDPVHAAEIEANLYQKESDLLAQNITESLSAAKMQIATLTLLESLDTPVDTAPATETAVEPIADIPAPIEPTTSTKPVVDVAEIKTPIVTDTVVTTETTTTTVVSTTTETTPVVTAPELPLPPAKSFEKEYLALDNEFTATKLLSVSTESIAQLKSISNRLQILTRAVEAAVLVAQTPAEPDTATIEPTQHATDSEKPTDTKSTETKPVQSATE